MGSGHGNAKQREEKTKLIKVINSSENTDEIKDAISVIEQYRCGEIGISEEELQAYLKGLNRVSKCHKILFELLSPNLFRVLLELLRKSFDVMYEKEGHKIKSGRELLPDLDYFQVLAAANTTLLVMSEDDLKTVEQIMSIIENLRSQDYFSTRIPDCYMLFVTYLFLFHHQRVFVERFKSNEFFAQCTEYIVGHLRRLMKEVIGVPVFCEHFLTEKSNTKFVVELTLKCLELSLLEQFTVMNDLLVILIRSEKFQLIYSRDISNNFFRQYVYSALTWVLIPEIAGREEIKAMDYNKSMEFLRVLMNIINILIEKKDFAKAYKQLMSVHELDLIWHLLWYSSFNEEERYFLQGAALVMKLMHAVFPQNSLPIYAERLHQSQQDDKIFQLIEQRVIQNEIFEKYNNDKQ